MARHIEAARFAATQKPGRRGRPDRALRLITGAGPPLQKGQAHHKSLDSLATVRPGHGRSGAQITEPTVGANSMKQNPQVDRPSAAPG